MVAAKALYSASVEEREMVTCFLDFHEMSESPRKTQKPITERLESTQVAQSAFEKAQIWREEEAGN